MPKKNISEDSFSMWNIDGDSKTWTLQQDATITVNNEPAVNVLATSVGNQLKLLGDIVASGDDGQGVLVSGVNTKVLIGNQSTIDADEGIHSTANGLRVINKGEIDGLQYGISSSTSANIKNLGDISGTVGVSTLGTSRVVNGEDAMIQGDTAGVIMGFGSDATLINHGLISGNTHAVHMFSGGDNRLINTGTIHGDIQFGNGNDLLDSRKGIIEGIVTGGDGDDIYRIGRNELDILEEAGEGNDRVYSNGSYFMSDHIESLYLTGKKDAAGGGNDEDNFINGNKGINTITGGEGNDYLAGGRGDDLLRGDGGDDVFVFAKGDDRDRIDDFTKGDDTIWLTGFEDITSFEELQSHMFKNGSDVWIQMGNGDRLIIESTDVGDLEASDFSFLAV